MTLGQTMTDVNGHPGTFFYLFLLFPTNYMFSSIFLGCKNEMPTLIVLVLLVTCHLVHKSAEEHHVLLYIEKKVGLIPAMLQQWPS